MRRDRQQNVRRAFRSFPLHELPASTRTINPFALYETYLAGGRVVLLPFYLLGAVGPRRWAWPSGASTGSSARSSIPRVDQDRTRPAGHLLGGAAEDPPNAQAGVHGIALAAGAGSTWSTWACRCPPRRRSIAAESLMEADLDYIGATRQDRIIAEQVRRQHQDRLEWVGRWLDRFGWTFDELPDYLSREIPYLANRGGEALRALVAACILDHDDIATLALSIEGIETVLAYAADPSSDSGQPPAGPPRAGRQSSARSGTPCTDASGPSPGSSTCRASPATTPASGGGSPAILRRHRRAVRGWVQRRARPGRRRTPGRPSGPGCATSCSAPTSGATRSSSSAPSRA